ncbi:PREDICTED: inositol phosphorylceramide glucuronosyltransferase 1 [Fragaria vesca subsp. vesca]|uniref:inositol phosphorylceramide glucuronosyltransferase 1 n=1 Tax=Fragaria vesca subsp. vesca TaxID=101020 RepID=UPI0002C2E656|nr:PREDICTED: inositol phosphorylceramide glucuronosyltransferase 1 [Fragaria vesca subsp. vesca]
MKPRFLLIVAFLLSAAAAIRSSDAASARQRTPEAYVTLLYGDEFLLGVRVLGKSIRDTGSTKDMVVLVSDGVSGYAMSLLKADGWIVEKISLLANPNQVRPTRFWGVYTKLKIFNMTNYKKVVYLDADTIVVKSVEDLFECSKFCANLKHSERLNSGVMVVEPSERVFQDMMGKVTTLESYTGGDQGFLNSYYSDFPNAHVFDPNLAPEVRKSRPVPEMERLSTLYNADVGLYMLANKWMVNESELRVIHYTLGPLKPWDWWTSWLLKPVDVWQDVRKGLKDSLPGTGGGINPNDALVVKILFSIPFLALLFCYYRSFLQTREYFGSLCRSSFYDQIKHIYYKIKSTGTLNYAAVSTSSNINLSNQTKVPCYLGGMSIVACFMAAMVALVVGLAVVPRQVMPWTGLLLMYEWTFTIFFLLFGGYIHLVYQWGRTTAVQATFSSGSESVDDDSGKRHQRQVSLCDSASLHYGLGMAFLAVAAPSLPCLFGVTALFLRLGLMVVGGLILASFMTYASEHLATRSFLRGLEDRDATRSRSFC